MRSLQLVNELLNFLIERRYWIKDEFLNKLYKNSRKRRSTHYSRR